MPKTISEASRRLDKVEAEHGVGSPDFFAAMNSAVGQVHAHRVDSLARLKTAFTPPIEPDVDDDSSDRPRA